MTRIEAIEAVKMDAVNWIEEGTAVKGWYTCTITGKKFRGADAAAQLEKQEVAIERMLQMAADCEMENEMDAELEFFAEQEPAIGEEQAKAIEEAANEEIASADSTDTDEEAMTGEINAEPVVNTATVQVNVDVKGHEADTLGAVHMTLGNDIGKITETLMLHIEDEAIKGKGVKLVTIQCVDCGADRLIKPQDVFQVKRCENCQKKHRNKMRAERRREKRQAEKAAQGK